MKKATNLLQANAAHALKIDSLALSCGVARRTLEKQFRGFVGQTPMELLRAQRLAQARRKLLAAQSHADVTRIATAAL